MSTAPADVCLVLEGTYPFVAGGVSSWVHDLIRAQSDLSFHLLTLMPDAKPRQHRYEVPKNVCGLTVVGLQDMPRGRSRVPGRRNLLRDLEPALIRLQAGGGLADLAELVGHLGSYRPGDIGRHILLDSDAAWNLLSHMYEKAMPSASFIDYFWSWRAQLGGLLATLICPLPPCRLYHAVSTGYAGLYAARARLITGRPAILTEHGIYTNERRIEIAMADWLSDASAAGLAIEKPRRDLRDLWIDTFIGYSRACYQACERIFTLYGGNQDLQRRDGAPPERLAIVPNGIDYARYSKVQPDPAARPPAVALIGRVVPIKDVKTFIRAAAILKDQIPDVKAYVMGPTDEDQEYFKECEGMVSHLGLSETVIFLGRVALTDHLGKLDAIALTSISEAQPLVILEAGAAGVPTVATDVGACREMIFGRSDEEPQLGPAGAIVSLSNPASTAQALARLLMDPAWRAKCSHAIRERVRRYYNKVDIDRIYRDIYAELRAAPDRPAPTAAEMAA
ncbi:MAG: DUF3492 domain-containing protein [Alphaproteobacteria bacterium]|nr:DUF3492 domain-containing protein [Alphaproteobacteria bacterium]